MADRANAAVGGGECNPELGSGPGPGEEFAAEASLSRGTSSPAGNLTLNRKATGRPDPQWTPLLPIRNGKERKDQWSTRKCAVVAERASTHAPWVRFPCPTEKR